MKKIFCFLIPLTIIACNSTDNNTSSQTKTIEPRQILATGKTNELFKKISSPIQKFVLNVKSDTTLTCKNGTVISLPKDCFVDQNGNIVNENITIQIVEALSLSDFLRNDLQTISENQILQSGGMLYLDATSNNQPLTLRENSSLYVELPTNIKTPGMKIFTGMHDDKGNINWTEKSTLDNGMIPLPLDEFNYTYYKKFIFENDLKPLKYLDSGLLHKNTKFEKTFISTVEFEQRFKSFNADYWYYWENYDANLNTNQIETGKPYSINCPLIEIYTKNIDKPLWYCDSLAYNYLKNWEIKDSIKYYKVNKWNGTNQIFYSSYAFKWFYDQRLDKVKPYDDRGVDMTRSSAKEELIKKGYTEKEAYEQVLIFNSRNRMIKQRKEERRTEMERAENRNKIAKAYTVAFNITQLGWVNVDQFFSDPKAKEVEFYVQTISDSLEFCDLTLLLPQRNIAINGILMSNGKYRFTKDDKQYRKLPIGESGILIAMSSKNGQPYFASQKLTIQEKQNITLNVNKSTWKEIESELTKMN